jgi:hypothetical protein
VRCHFAPLSILRFLHFSPQVLDTRLISTFQLGVFARQLLLDHVEEVYLVL